MRLIACLLLAFLLKAVQATYQVVESQDLDGYAIRVKRFESGEVCSTGANHSAGWADIGRHHLFYWFHEARHDKFDKPLMLWLQGGPGTPSTAEGLLSEHGPCMATENASDGLIFNPYSWTELFNIIYVDQPSGTGYSYTDPGTPLHSRSEDSSQDLVAVFLLFQEAFPEYSKLPLYVAGESYAGRFIPLLADAIVRHNEQSQVTIPLTGLLIGNGWTAPTVQYPSLYEVGCHPFVETEQPYMYLALQNYFNSTECAQIASIIHKCRELMGNCELVRDGAICATAGEFCASHIDIDNYRANNMFDRRRTCHLDPPDACFARENNAVDWLNSEAAQQAFEIREQTGRDIPVEGISLPVFNSFRASGDYFTNSIPELASVLDYSAKQKARALPGIDVLYYTGITDLVCNPVGVRRLLGKVPWTKQAEFVDAEWQKMYWRTSEGSMAGRYKAVDGLWMAELADAGHMAPIDQPTATLTLLRHWMELRSTYRGALPSGTMAVTDGIHELNSGQKVMGDS